jgi:hypothetical protein
MNLGFMPIGVMIGRVLAKVTPMQAEGIGTFFVRFNIGIGIVGGVSRSFSRNNHRDS